MADKLYSTAAIIGCTPAGLLAAQTLTDFFARVILLDTREPGTQALQADPQLLRDDLSTHPQVRILIAHEPVAVLLHASGSYTVGVRYCVDDHAAPETCERAIIADLVIDSRAAHTTATAIEGLLELGDAPAQWIGPALRNSLRPQRHASHRPQPENLIGLAARFKQQLRQLALQ